MKEGNMAILNKSEVFMISIRQIKKITRKAYPFSKYSYTERHKLRKMLTNDILSYLEEYPNATLDSLEKHFLNEELDLLPDSPKFNFNIKTIFLIFVIVVFICLVIIFISNQLNPPTYYFK